MKQIKNRKQLIEEYIDFFKSKNHKQIPNSPLIPKEDPTVLFTTAGMHPLVPYLLGQKHPQGRKLTNVQKCVRTGDIEEVGDAFHLTFFEMLGNWSLGDYFKKQAIQYSYEFLTDKLKIPKEKLKITCFKGDKKNNIPKDTEAAKYWQGLGIKKDQIKFLGKKENWWGPAGKTGPCGPDTEMFYNNSEIWNNVFMQYNKTKKGYKELKQKNVDTGMGVERTLAVLQGKDMYKIPCFLPLIKQIEKLSEKKYGENKEETKSMRIIADHLKASVFILAEHIHPSNTEHGYVLRRLIRRAIRYGKLLNINKPFIKKIGKKVVEIYHDYKHLQKNKEFILKQLEGEEKLFSKTIKKGVKEFEKITKNLKNTISGKKAFLLYQSYGFPLEMTKEMAKEKNLKVDAKSFEKEQEKHKEKSRTKKGKFKSGLADQTEKTKKLHTATHLLLAALRKFIDKNIEQRGSNITEKRLRFDFNFDRKLTDKEVEKIENFVNDIIKKGLKVKREEMTLEKAKKRGATGIFNEKYGSKVSVYTIKNKEVISKEICAGPHVSNTSELGKSGKFKVYKQESPGKSLRRIKAKLE